MPPWAIWKVNKRPAAVVPERSGPPIVAGLSQVNEQDDQKGHDRRVDGHQQKFPFRIGDKDKKDEARGCQQEHEVLQDHLAKHLDIAAARQSTGDHIPKHLSDFVHPVPSTLGHRLRVFLATVHLEADDLRAAAFRRSLLVRSSFFFMVHLKYFLVTPLNPIASSIGKLFIQDWKKSVKNES